MTPRLCYPTDVPKGALIVRDKLTVADVAVWRDENGDPLVAICDANMRTILYPIGARIEIDENTPDRAERLAFANAIVVSHPGVRRDRPRRRIDTLADLVSWKPNRIEG